MDIVERTVLTFIKRFFTNTNRALLTAHSSFGYSRTHTPKG